MLIIYKTLKIVNDCKETLLMTNRYKLKVIEPYMLTQAIPQWLSEIKSTCLVFKHRCENKYRPYMTICLFQFN